MARFFNRTCHFSLVTLFFSLFTLASCQEGGEAGDLFGQWRMNGSVTSYISFSGSITLMHDETKGEVYGNFQHVGDSLFVQCYSKEALPSDTAMVESTFGFKPFSNIRLRIATLDSDRLVLTQGNKTWEFFKY